MAEDIRILHVDDDRDFSSLTAEFLELQDDRFTVSAASDSSAGLRRLEDEPFDCIISDYDMPGRSGIEFLTAVRERDPDIPFILFTGKGSEEVASDAISAGVTDYLQKDTGSEQYELLANRITTAVEQYRTERELERQNDLFSKAQDIANVGAWEYNLESDESYVSDEILRIYGLDTDTELPVSAGVEYYHPDDRATIRDAFEAALESGESYDVEARLIDADGEQRWVRTRGEPQYVDGEIVRLRGILQDITEQKHRENKLQRQNKRLEEFAHVVSHDIRNPLQVASGQFELAERDGDPEHFEKGQEALDRISTIIENLLTLARHGRTVEEMSTVQLSAISGDAWETVETGSLTLECDGNGGIDADTERIQQLLANLFRNTVDHAEGATTIRVGPIQPMFTSTRAAGDTTTGFYVEDDGRGIDGGIRETVFESGFTTAPEGTGFGLAIVAQIAEAHGWEARVSEGRDGGARFEFVKRNAPDMGMAD